MKINKKALAAAYKAKIDKICEDCDDKSHFSIDDIVSIVADLIETGKFIDSALYTQKEVDKLLHDEYERAVYNCCFHDG